MKSLFALLLMVPVLAQAESAEWWQPRESVLNVTGRIGFSDVLTTNATPTSHTIPTGARCVRFDPTTNYWHCADNAANRYCGTARPTTTVSQTAWDFNANQRRFQTVSGTVPDTLWVQVQDSNTQVVGHWYVCQ